MCSSLLGKCLGVECPAHAACLVLFLLSCKNSESFIIYVFCRYFLSACVLSFHFINSVIQGADVLHVDEVNLLLVVVVVVVVLFVSHEILA